jgi:hypothetical protein
MELGWRAPARVSYGAVGALQYADQDIPAYVGYVGFQNRGSQLRSTMTSRFGPGRSTTYRY